MRIQSEYYFYSSFVMVCVLINSILNTGLLSWDVSNLLYDTKLFLTGGTYVKDFFETNPPMIFFLYSPVIWIAKLTGMSDPVIVRIYTMLVAMGSIICCSALLVKILSKDDDPLRFFLLYVLTFVFLLLPAFEFSQREHFLIILIMPYLFSAVAVAQRKSIHTVFAVFIGIMAGLGFGMKPYFLTTLILVECYLIMTRNVLSFLRIESIVCASMLLLYLMYIFEFHPNYIHIMLPLLNQFYFSAIKQPWISVLTNPITLFCMAVLGYYIFFYQKKYYRELVSVLLLAMCGMMLAYFIPRAPWRYHVIPALSLSCLLVMIFIYQVFHKKMKKILFAVLISFLFPLYFFMNGMIKFLNVSQIFESDKLIQYLRHTDQSKIYCLFPTMLCYPLAAGTGHQFSGRFPMFWWVKGAVQVEHENRLTETISKQKDYLINAVIEDIHSNRPKLVIVSPVKISASLDILEYFLQNEKFHNAWRSYQYVDTYGGFKVYKRNNVN